MTVVVLVDGSNVARCAAWKRHVGPGASEHDLRRGLVDSICSWAATAGVEVRITFDGAGPWRPGTIDASPDVQVIGTGASDGDDVLAKLATECRRADREHWFVSSDRALRLVAGASAVREPRADEFVEELLAAVGAASADLPRDVLVDSPDASPTRVTETLDDDTRAKLERLRRGLDANGD